MRYELLKELSEEQAQLSDRRSNLLAKFIQEQVLPVLCGHEKQGGELNPEDAAPPSEIDLTAKS